VASPLDELLRIGSRPTTGPGSRRPPELPPAAAIAEIPLGRQRKVPMRDAERSLAVFERLRALLPTILALPD
jgi:hypothetical protein